MTPVTTWPPLSTFPLIPSPSTDTVTRITVISRNPCHLGLRGRARIAPVPAFSMARRPEVVVPVRQRPDPRAIARAVANLEKIDNPQALTALVKVRALGQFERPSRSRIAAENARICDKSAGGEARIVSQNQRDAATVSGRGTRLLLAPESGISANGRCGPVRAAEYRGGHRGPPTSNAAGVDAFQQAPIELVEALFHLSIGGMNGTAPLQHA